MMIPSAVEHLDEPDIAFGHAASQKAVGRESPWLCGLLAVHLERRFRLTRNVDQFGHRGLHSERHLVLGDPRLCLGVASACQHRLVHRLQSLDHHPSHVAADTGRIRELQHRVSLRADGAPGMTGRQETAAPQPRQQRLASLALGHQHDESGQV